MIGIMLLQGRNSVPKENFPIPLIHIGVLRQTKTSIDVTSGGDHRLFFGIWMEASHCLNPGSARFTLLNKNPPEVRCGFKKQVTTRPKKLLAIRVVQRVKNLSA